MRSSVQALVALDSQVDRGVVETLLSAEPLSVLNYVDIEHPNGETRVTTSVADGVKCERCWNYTADVGQDARYPTVCLRCAEALDAIDFPPYTAEVTA